MAAGAAAVAVWASALLIPLADTDAGTPDASDVALGVVLGLLVPLAVYGVGTYLVRRPQPVVSPALVGADDAVRAASVRTLATVGTTILLIDVAGGLVPWAAVAHGLGDLLLTVAVAVALVLAALSWSAHNVWSRPHPGRGRPAAAGAAGAVGA